MLYLFSCNSAFQQLISAVFLTVIPTTTSCATKQITDALWN